MKSYKESNTFDSVVSFIKKNVMGVSILAASLLVMGIANAFFLPYVFTALINDTGVAWYEYLIGSVLFCVAVAGLVWAITTLCYRNRKQDYGVRNAAMYFGSILLTLLVIGVIGMIYSFIIGQLGVSWYYLLKDIVAAKIAIDITARAFSVPLNALFFCILGNVLMKKRPVYKLTTSRYFRLFVVAAVYAAVEYLMTIPAINSTWLLILTCVLNTAMYTLIVVIALVLCNDEDSDSFCEEHEADALYDEFEPENYVFEEEGNQMKLYDENKASDVELNDNFEELPLDKNDDTSEDLAELDKASDVELNDNSEDLPSDKDDDMSEGLAEVSEEFAEVEVLCEGTKFESEEAFDDFDKDFDGGFDDE